MAFREIHAFNLVMLAKQAWRLTQDTHSLFFKVYKARYFPNCSFMKAAVGHNPSFVWRSLLEVRESIWAAIVWKVGDGRSIRIDDHRWLPHPPQLRPEVDKNLRVSDLFNTATRQWHTHVLLSTFMPTTMTDIQLINLIETENQDRLIWKENKKGAFSVKMAY